MQARVERVAVAVKPQQHEPLVDLPFDHRVTGAHVQLVDVDHAHHREESVDGHAQCGRQLSRELVHRGVSTQQASEGATALGA